MSTVNNITCYWETGVLGAVLRPWSRHVMSAIFERILVSFRLHRREPKTASVCGWPVAGYRTFYCSVQSVATDLNKQTVVEAYGRCVEVRSLSRVAALHVPLNTRASWSLKPHVWIQPDTLTSVSLMWVSNRGEAAL
jgi:hypothetical protein